MLIKKDESIKSLKTIFEEKYPKVSILIPTYNRAHEIERAIDSALMQDYPNIEVIISDDASNDSTGDVISKYSSDERLKYHRNSKNLKAPLNVKKLVYEYTDSEWFLLMSDDDYLLDSNHISKAINLAKEDDEIVLIHANCREYFEYGNYFHDTEFNLPMIQDGKWYFLNLPDKFNIFPVTVLWKTGVVKRVEGFSGDKLCADWAAIFKLCFNGKIGFINEVAGVFTYSDKNASSRVYADDIAGEIAVCVEEPYEYAKRMKVFPESVLDRWREKNALFFFNGLFSNRNRTLSTIYSQLFIDIGDGFHEHMSVKRYFPSCDCIISFDLKKNATGGIKGLKFVPLNTNCVVKIRKIILKDHAGNLHNVERYEHNAGIKINDTFYFSNENPNFFLYIDIKEIGFTENISEVIFDLQYLSVVKKAYENIIKTDRLENQHPEPVKSHGLLINSIRRFIKGSVAWLTLSPVSRPRRILRRFLIIAKQYVSSKPRIKKIMVRIISLSPKLKARLKMVG